MNGVGPDPKGVPSPPWQPLCGTADIPNDRALSAAVAGVEYVVWRDPTRGVCVSDAICPHRGASLAGGLVVEGQLVCPLHGWRFAGDGRNVHRPDGQPLSRVRLRCYGVTEHQGVIYLQCSTERQPL